MNKKGFLNITKQQIIVEGSLFFSFFPPELINICFVCIVPLCRLMMAIFHSVQRQKQRNVLVLIKISDMLMRKQMAIHHRMHLCTTMDNFTSQLTALSLTSLMLAAGCMTFLRFRKRGGANECFVSNSN